MTWLNNLRCFLNAPKLVAVDDLTWADGHVRLRHACAACGRSANGRHR